MNKNVFPENAVVRVITCMQDDQIKICDYSSELDDNMIGYAYAFQGGTETTFGIDVFVQENMRG